MPEEQQHGLAFEDWVKKTFFKLYYTSEWDVPRELNPHPENGPISIKTAKWGSGVAFGDARRQFDIQEPFTLIVGFWEQRGTSKRIVKVVETVVPKNRWRSIWTPITRADLDRIDALIKRRDFSPQRARQEADAALKAVPFSQAVITLNRKIDSKKQRRLQCSLSRSAFFEYLAIGVSREPDAQPALWGQPVGLRLPGGPRGANRQCHKLPEPR